MKLIWNGHSCFTLHSGSTTIVLDPYDNGYVPGYSVLSLQADAVYCSHGHNDHGAAHIVALSGEPCPIPVTTLDTWHDEVQGAKRGANRIHIFTCEGMRVAHLGDLGCELTPEQVDTLHGVDVLLIPVGGFYTIDAKQAAGIVAQLAPRIVIPMHYRSDTFGYEVLSGVNDFLALCPGTVTRLDTNEMEITPETPSQILVPAYCPN